MLPIFNKINKQMQSESTHIHVLHTPVSSTLRTLLGCYMKESYLARTPLSQVRLRDPGNFKKIEDMYLGVQVVIEVCSNHYEKNDLEQFGLKCLEFYIEAASQIYKRISFDSADVECLKALSLKVVFGKQVPSLTNLLQKYIHIADNIQDVDTEWRLLSNSLGTLVEVNSSMKPEEFWCRVSETKGIDDNPMFPNVTRTLICLPPLKCHS